ncbi:MAG: radical SAM protein [bacterium]|nr:radical SAM protein [bacterium]
MQKNNENIKQNEVLSLEVTTRCNLSCRNCFALAELSRQANMEWETTKKIAEEGCTLGFKILHLTGGEPFLWEHTYKLLDYAFDIGYEKFLINTNATLLNSEKCERLVPYKEKLILTCSINGPQNIHESIRGTGAYEKACAGIDTALQHELNVDIYTTVGKDLLPQIPVFVESLFKRFPNIKNHFIIQLRRVENDFYPLLDKMLSPQDFISLVTMTGLLFLNDYPIFFLENPLSTVVANLRKMDWLPASPAISRNGKLIVLQDGTITANHSSRESYGNYTPGELNRVLNSNNFLQDISPDTEICPPCEFNEICRAYGMLRPSSYNHSDIKNKAEEPFCKRVLQQLKKSVV